MMDATAHISADDPAMTNYTNIKMTELPVTPITVIECNLTTKGGQALRLIPDH
jgi:hypothetical protein